MNLEDNLINKLESKGVLIWFWKNGKLSNPYFKEIDEISVGFNKQPSLTIKRIPKKKKITVDWVMDKLENKKMLKEKNLSNKIKFENVLDNILSKLKLNSINSIEPTQYGYSLNNSNNKTHLMVVGLLVMECERKGFKYKFNLKNTKV